VASVIVPGFLSGPAVAYFNASVSGTVKRTVRLAPDRGRCRSIPIYPAIRIGPSALLGLLRLTWSPARPSMRRSRAPCGPFNVGALRDSFFTDHTLVVEEGYYC
jgi:hypothetical protein